MRKNIELALLAIPIFFFAGPGSAETAYFVVSELARPCNVCDSYILPLSDPAAIAHARDLVSLGPEAGSTIALANVVAGGDEINRDVLANGEPLWSWHITSFIGFGDFAIELCDGTPGMVEADPTAFLANTNGVICFWSYAVTEELPGRPIPMGRGVGLTSSFLIALATWFLFARNRRNHGPEAESTH